MPGKVPHPKVHSQVTTREEWLVARKELLVKEKEATRAKDKLTKMRAELPMVNIDKKYTFTDANNKQRELKDLFDGRKQLIIYHFMLGPTDENPCEGCSSFADNIPPTFSSLNSRSTTFALVSRAPIDKILEVRKRKGWEHLPWYSSFESDFNFDFQATVDAEHNVYNYKQGKVGEEGGERPGMSVFLEDGESVYHTYSTYQRGLEAALWGYGLLDMTVLGRQD